MSNRTAYRLSRSAVAEPLVNWWSAWAHLMPPVPASLHLQHYQMEILRSYLEDPQFHAQACQDRKLRSGRFVDIPAERAGEVKDLVGATEKKLSANLELARSLRQFHNHLAGVAKGQSLDGYYKELPPALRGYVELVYDYYNHPIVRFFESLLYESPYYHEDLQSLRLFRHTSDDARPFIMSTPRLPEAGQIDWRLPFADPRVDEFFKLDRAPQTLGRIRELCGLSTADEPALLPLLSEEPPPEARRWDGPSARVRYFGHACVLVEWKGVSVLTDPNLGVVPSEGGLERFTFEDLPEEIDYALVTHNHHDHFCLETLLRLRHRIGCLVVPRCSGVFYGDPSLKLLAENVGFKNVVELDTLASIPLPDGAIIAVPFLGEHADLPHSKTAYVVRAGREQILFGADSDCLDQAMYRHVRQAVGGIQTVFLGMECVGAPLSWSAGAFLPARPERSHDQSRRYKGCDSGRAQAILEAVGAERIYIYAMGMEPWLEYLLGLAYTGDSVQLLESGELLLRVRERGFATAERLFGKREMHLDGSAAGRAWRAVPAGNVGDGHSPSPPVSVSAESDENEGAARPPAGHDEEDQFAFE